MQAYSREPKSVCKLLVVPRTASNQRAKALPEERRPFRRGTALKQRSGVRLKGGKMAFLDGVHQKDTVKSGRVHCQESVRSLPC